MTNHADIPLVSVVMPAHNDAEHVAEAIESILAQDYPAREVIVVDDGSTDNTAGIVETYRSHVRLLRQPNSGSAVARNRGLEAARGEYVAFLDADDVWLPGKLTAQVEYMEQNPAIAMTYGRWQQWDPERDGSLGDVLARMQSQATEVTPSPALVSAQSGWIYHLLLLDFVVWTSVVMMRRELMERVGWFDDRFERGQDFDYWLRASRHTEIHMLDRPMALYRQHPANSTRQCPQRNYAAEIIDQALERWGDTGPDGSKPDPARLREHRGRLWSMHAYKQLQARRTGQAARSLVRALRHGRPEPRLWAALLYRSVAKGRTGNRDQKMAS